MTENAPSTESATTEERLWDIEGAPSPSGNAFARAFELAHAMIREFDGRIRFWSSSMEHLYGWSRAEALGCMSHDLLKTEFPKRLDDINAELLRVGHWHGELRHRGRDGRTIVVASHWALDRDQAGRPAWVIEVNSDISAQKAAEARLRARTAELETVLGAVPAIVWIAHDVDCRSVTGNHASSELLRLSVGANPSLTAPEGERPVHFKVRSNRQELAPEKLPVQRAARGETIRGCEVEVVFDDGTSRWIFGNAAPLLDDEGRPRGAVSAFVDVTERKEAEERYRRTAELLQRVMASIPDYLWSGELDEHGQWKYNYYSPVVERITGRPPSFYMESPERWLTTVHPDDREYCLRAFQRIAAGESDHEQAEYRIVLPNGKVRWVRDSASVTYLAPHRFRVDGVVSDVTDRKRAEAALRASEERYARLANATREGVAIHDSGIIVEANATFARMFGFALDEVIGKPLSLVIPELSAPSEEIREASGVRKDGTTFPIEISGSTIENEGRPIRIKLVWDLTAQKAVEASLRDSQARLENLQSELLHVSRLTDMGQMAAALAHEINQPLASATNYLGGCRLLLAKSEVNTRELDKVRDSFALASDQMVRAGEIIRRMRNFLARGEIERRLGSAKEVLEEASSLALMGVSGRGITVRTEVNTSAQVLVDRIQVQQVLVNLVRNAVDAMHDTPRKELTIQVSEKDDMVETCVSDTGEGLSGEVADRLFEPFASTKAEGMGIGLSVCRKIIDDHGGKISARPRPGGGTTFCFTIPAAQV
jgi:two-component system, LuxR family, sensor kinase FixL